MAHRDAYRSESSILATLIESPNTRPASVDWEPSWSPTDRAEVESSRWLVDSESTPSLEASERDLGHPRSFRLSPAGAQPGTEAQSLAGANAPLSLTDLRHTRSWPAPTRDPGTEHGVARGRHRHDRSDVCCGIKPPTAPNPSSPAPTCAERRSVTAWSDRTSPTLVAGRRAHPSQGWWEHQLFPNVGRCAPRDWS